jgi:hypothetical protein
MVLSIVMLGAAGLALVVSVLLALRGARERRLARHFEARAVAGTAEVVEARPKDVAVAGEPATIYFHLVRLALPDGSTTTAETMAGTQPPVPRVGERVAVRYDPEHPERVVLADVDHTSGAGATALGLARVMLGLAVSLPVAWALIVAITEYAV